MDNNVIVKISGLQVVEETGDNIEMLAVGRHYIKNNKHYLIYEEIEDDNDTVTKNTIKFNDMRAEVMRKGVVNGKLVFQKGENNQSIYSTPFGELLVEVMTKDIELNQNKDSINLKIDYELYANNNKISNNKIEIDIKNA